jgi:hypothetical protein
MISGLAITNLLAHRCILLILLKNPDGFRVTEDQQGILRPKIPVGRRGDNPLLPALNADDGNPELPVKIQLRQSFPDPFRMAL